jgi:hypothetical protein
MQNSIQLKDGRTVTVVCTDDNLCINVKDADGRDRSLTLYEDENSIASLDADGIEVHLYKSAIDGKVVADILTATPGVVEHDANEVPLIRVCINDDDVFDGGDGGDAAPAAPATNLSVVPKIPTLRALAG